MRVVTYNPLTCADPARLVEISEQFRRTAIVMLTGTALRTDEKMELDAEKRTLPHHTMYSFGWDRAEHSNKAAGVAVLLGRETFGRSPPCRLFVPDESIRGRGGALRTKAMGMDVTVAVAYPPPQPGAERATRKWRSCLGLLFAFLTTVLEATPRRSTPVVGIDLNGAMGVPEEGCPASEHIGEIAAGLETYQGTMFRRLVQRFDLFVPQATICHRGESYTYVGPRGHESRIDFLALPTGLRQQVHGAQVLRTVARALQLIPHRDPRDHLLVAVDFDRPEQSRGREQQKGVQWDLDRIQEAMTYGAGRAGFFAEVESRCEDKRERTFRQAQEPTPDNLWQEFVQDIQEVGEKHFGRRQHDDQLKEWKEEGRRLLRARWMARTKLDDRLGSHFRLESLTRLIKKRVRAQASDWKRAREDELREAWRTRDLSLCWKLAQRLGGKQTAPRKRV